jgi:hypothetical protein
VHAVIVVSVGVLLHLGDLGPLINSCVCFCLRFGIKSPSDSNSVTMPVVVVAAIKRLLRALGLGLGCTGAVRHSLCLFVTRSVASRCTSFVLVPDVQAAVTGRCAQHSTGRRGPFSSELTFKLYVTSPCSAGQIN